MTDVSSDSFSSHRLEKNKKRCFGEQVVFDEFRVNHIGLMGIS